MGIESKRGSTNGEGAIVQQSEGWHRGRKVDRGPITMNIRHKHARSIAEWSGGFGRKEGSGWGETG